MQLLLLSIALTFVTPASAEVYRSLDEDGNVVFTDKPSPSAEELDIDSVQTISPPAVRNFEYTSPRKPEKNKYTKLEISSPANDQVFTDGSGNVTVSVLITPELNISPGDRLVLYIDGKKHADSVSTSFSFTNMDRGTHTVKVDVVDRGGKSLKSSAPVSFTVKRFSILHPNRPAPRAN